MPAKLDRCVKGIVKEKIAEYRKRYKKEPSKKRKEEIESAAWGICKKVLNL